MLADPRASSLVTSFAMKWLTLTTLDQVVPDPNLFRGFNEQLRRDFSTEAQAFIGSVFSEDRSVVELLTADYTFLNDRLASHYGISGVTGAQFRKVTLTDTTRFGLLGKAAVQLRTSYGDRTSPVLRGAWVLDKLMGAPPKRDPCRPENRQQVSYEVSAGKLILFESWLRHEVASNPTRGERVSISFNYNWV